VSLAPISALDAAADLSAFDTIVDARSPAEYADDHLPGALNWPVLDDDERRVVGTEYKQVSSFDARKRGAAIVARRIADIVEREVADKPKGWQPLVYCWRGGQRSGTLAWFLAQIGFRTHVLQGGYKAFRALVRDQLAEWPARFDWRVVAGRTGSAKTRLLQALQAEGAQVLDLEGLARHRGSVLGGLEHEPQPTQKAFDTAVWHALTRFDATLPVFVESESRKIGSLALPDALLDAMRASPRCITVTLPEAERIKLLLDEYGFFAGQLERFCAHLDSLVELRGRAVVARWQATARAGQRAELYAELMREHYDPLYERSMQRNFAGLARAQAIELADASAASLQAAARSLRPAR
jgi:tRNA 2-selenouridine synthase